MALENNNPLTAAILTILNHTTEPLAIHQLLSCLKQEMALPALHENMQMAVFKLNWLMMNALYCLQEEFAEAGYCLSISSLDIHLEKAANDKTTSKAIQGQALKDYYLDWRNFYETSLDEVQELLSGLWQNKPSYGVHQAALKQLGLGDDANLKQVQSAYRRLASRYHPDKGGNVQQFIAVREAYEIVLQRFVKK